MTPWTFWIVLAAILAIAEMMTGTFYLLVLALGAVVGALAAVLGLSMTFQVLGATLAAAAGFAALQNYRARVGARAPAAKNPDVHPDIGAVVRIASVDPGGRVCVNYRGADWTARVDGGVVDSTRDYQIAQIDGSVLVLTLYDTPPAA